MDNDFVPKPEHCYALRSFFSSESNEAVSHALPTPQYKANSSICSARSMPGHFQDANRSASPLSTRSSSPSYAMLRSEMEMRKQTALDYARAEAIHVDVAFAHQRARIESEWIEYLQQMQEEFEMNLARLEHRETRDIPRSQSQSPLSASWQSNEKQSQLIHTAPVLSPKTETEAYGFRSTEDSLIDSREQIEMKSKAKRIVAAKNAAAIKRADRLRQAEVLNLKAKYDAEVKSVMQQKEKALCWVGRRHSKMKFQIECMNEEVKRRSAHDDFLILLASRQESYCRLWVQILRKTFAMIKAEKR